jgi:hypothetical protein
MPKFNVRVTIPNFYWEDLIDADTEEDAKDKAIFFAQFDMSECLDDFLEVTDIHKVED